MSRSTADPVEPDAVPRAGVRVPALLDACFESGEVCEGQLIDLSVAGARIAESDYLPPVGEEIKLVVGFSRDDRPVELIGVVVRHADERSFAVEFRKLVQGVDTHLSEVFGNALVRRARPRASIPAADAKPLPAAPPRGALRRWLHRCLLGAAARLT